MSYKQRVLLTEDVLSSLVVQKVLVDSMLQEVGVCSESELTISLTTLTEELDHLQSKSESTMLVLAAINSQLHACETCTQQLSAVSPRASQALPQLRADEVKSAIEKHFEGLHDCLPKHRKILREVEIRMIEVKESLSTILSVRSKFDMLSMQLQHFYDFKSFLAGPCSRCISISDQANLPALVKTLFLLTQSDYIASNYFRSELTNVVDIVRGQLSKAKVYFNSCVTMQHMKNFEFSIDDMNELKAHLCYCATLKCGLADSFLLTSGDLSDLMQSVDNAVCSYRDALIVQFQTVFQNKDKLNVDAVRWLFQTLSFYRNNGASVVPEEALLRTHIGRFLTLKQHLDGGVSLPAEDLNFLHTYVAAFQVAMTVESKRLFRIGAPLDPRISIANLVGEKSFLLEATALGLLAPPDTADVFESIMFQLPSHVLDNHVEGVLNHVLQVIYAHDEPGVKASYKLNRAKMEKFVAEKLDEDLALMQSPHYQECMSEDVKTKVSHTCEDVVLFRAMVAEQELSIQKRLMRAANYGLTKPELDNLALFAAEFKQLTQDGCRVQADKPLVTYDETLVRHVLKDLDPGLAANHDLTLLQTLVNRRLEPYKTEIVGALLARGSGDAMNIPYLFLKDWCGEFREDYVIGQGGFSVVYKAIVRADLVVVVKRLHLSGVFNIQEVKSRAKREIDFLLKLRHPSIIRMLGYYMPSHEFIAGGGDLSQLSLVFEYASEGSLYDVLAGAAAHKLTWKDRVEALVDITSALNYMHSESIFHRDVKAKNVVLDSCFRAKLIDCGLAKQVGQKPMDDSFESKSSQRVCSLGYPCMQYMMMNIPFDAKTEIYSTGIVLLEILSGVVQKQMGEEFVHNYDCCAATVPDVRAGDWNEELVQRLKDLAQQCIRPRKDRIPSMSDLHQELVRLKTAFCVRNSVEAHYQTEIDDYRLKHITEENKRCFDDKDKFRVCVICRINFVKSDGVECIGQTANHFFCLRDFNETVKAQCREDCRLKFCSEQQAKIVCICCEQNLPSEVTYFSDRDIMSRCPDDVLEEFMAAKRYCKVNKPFVSSCPRTQLCHDVLQHELSLPKEFFDSAGDQCFCATCMAGRDLSAASPTRGVPPSRYCRPLGFTRFGLQLQRGVAELHKVFETWHVSYHATSAESAKKIFASGCHLLKAGDTALGGHVLGVVPGHIKKPFNRTNLSTGLVELFDPNQIFTSPSIAYVSTDTYAKPQTVIHEGRTVRIKYVFQCRQRPGSYCIGQETVGADRRGERVHPGFENREIEWYTLENVGIVLTGLLMIVDV